MNYPPHLVEIFEKLRNGYHISPEDDVLYPPLNGKPEDYEEYFSGLGLSLKKHKFDFYYFEPEDEDRNSPRLAKIAVFSFILIDHIANRGLPVEPTIFADSFSIRGLPHFGLESYRERLEQVGIIDHGDLRDVINHLKNVGWAKWIADDEFQFLRPFHRMLDKCLELAKQAGDSADEQVPFASLNAPAESVEKGKPDA